MVLSCNNSHRSITVDIAKGLGIFLVVWGHCLHNNNVLHDVIYLFHMPLFFFLSGFFIKRDSFMTCFRKRSKRLLQPFIFYYIFEKVWNILNSLILLHKLPTFDTHFFLTIGPIWFLLALFIMLIMMNTFMLLKKEKDRFLLCAMVFTIGYSLGIRGIALPFYTTQAFVMMPFLYLGYYFRNVAWKQEGNFIYKLINCQNRYTILIFILSIIWLWFARNQQFDLYGMVFPIAHQLLLNAIVGISGILAISKLISRLSTIHFCSFLFFLKRMLQSWGINSLHIMGLHFPLVSTAYFICIPIVMYIQRLLHLDISEGIFLRYDCLWLSLTLAVVLTFVSSFSGKYIQQHIPSLFGNSKIR